MSGPLNESAPERDGPRAGHRRHLAAAGLPLLPMGVGDIIANLIQGILAFFAWLWNFVVSLPGTLMDVLFVVGTTAIVVVITVAFILAVVLVPYGAYVGGQRLYRGYLEGE